MSEESRSQNNDTVSSTSAVSSYTPSRSQSSSSSISSPSISSSSSSLSSSSLLAGAPSVSPADREYSPSRTDRVQRAAHDLYNIGLYRKFERLFDGYINGGSAEENNRLSAVKASYAPPINGTERSDDVSTHHRHHGHGHASAQEMRREENAPGERETPSQKQGLLEGMPETSMDAEMAKIQHTMKELEQQVEHMRQEGHTKTDSLNALWRNYYSHQDSHHEGHHGRHHGGHHDGYHHGRHHGADQNHQSSGASEAKAYNAWAEAYAQTAPAGGSTSRESQGAEGAQSMAPAKETGWRTTGSAQRNTTDTSMEGAARRTGTSGSVPGGSNPVADGTSGNPDGKPNSTSVSPDGTVPGKDHLTSDLAINAVPVDATAVSSDTESSSVTPSESSTINEEVSSKAESVSEGVQSQVEDLGSYVTSKAGDVQDKVEVQAESIGNEIQNKLSQSTSEVQKHLGNKGIPAGNDAANVGEKVETNIKGLQNEVSPKVQEVRSDLSSVAQEMQGDLKSKASEAEKEVREEVESSKEKPASSSRTEKKSTASDSKAPVKALTVSGGKTPATKKVVPALIKKVVPSPAGTAHHAKSLTGSPLIKNHKPAAHHGSPAHGHHGVHHNRQHDNKVPVTPVVEGKEKLCKVLVPVEKDAARDMKANRVENKPRVKDMVAEKKADSENNSSSARSQELSSSVSPKIDRIHSELQSKTIDIKGDVQNRVVSLNDNVLSKVQHMSHNLNSQAEKLFQAAGSLPWQASVPRSSGGADPQKNQNSGASHGKDVPGISQPHAAYIPGVRPSPVSAVPPPSQSSKGTAPDTKHHGSAVKSEGIAGKTERRGETGSPQEPRALNCDKGQQAAEAGKAGEQGRAIAGEHGKTHDIAGKALLQEKAPVKPQEASQEKSREGFPGNAARQKEPAQANVQEAKVSGEKKISRTESTRTPVNSPETSARPLSQGYAPPPAAEQRENGAARTVEPASKNTVDAEPVQAKSTVRETGMGSQAPGALQAPSAGDPSKAGAIVRDAGSSREVSPTIQAPAALQVLSENETNQVKNSEKDKDPLRQVSVATREVPQEQVTRVVLRTSLLAPQQEVNDKRLSQPAEEGAGKPQAPAESNRHVDEVRSLKEMRDTLRLIRPEDIKAPGKRQISENSDSRQNSPRAGTKKDSGLQAPARADSMKVPGEPSIRDRILQSPEVAMKAPAKSEAFPSRGKDADIQGSRENAYFMGAPDKGASPGREFLLSTSQVIKPRTENVPSAAPSGAPSAPPVTKAVPETMESHRTLIEKIDSLVARADEKPQAQKSMQAAPPAAAPAAARDEETKGLQGRIQLSEKHQGFTKTMGASVLRGGKAAAESRPLEKIGSQHMTRISAEGGSKDPGGYARSVINDSVAGAETNRPSLAEQVKNEPRTGQTPFLRVVEPKAAMKQGSTGEGEGEQGRDPGSFVAAVQGQKPRAAVISLRKEEPPRSEAPAEQDSTVMVKQKAQQDVQKDAVQKVEATRQTQVKQENQAVQNAASSIESVIKKSQKESWTGNEMAAKLIYMLMKASSTFTFDHSSRVIDLSVSLARQLGVTDEKQLRSIEDGARFHDIGEVELDLKEAPSPVKERLSKYLGVIDLKNCSFLHDIGKVKIPDSILYKPGRLTDEEFEVLKQHPLIGEELLKPLPAMSHVLPVVRNHHEKYDGSGYPDKLKGEDIPLAARIVSITDAFDAMVSDRPYRKGMTVENAVEELKRCAGTHFDPKLVEAFLRIIEEPMAQSA
ncbi:MAG: HD domain-containing phosphohydrolase [Candidatus Eremiobacteraeota bacterium]|nr:HD domain-containing phosphohydrolase [Candidatus Eremiobacteraeota bacterium]